MESPSEQVRTKLLRAGRGGLFPSEQVWTGHMGTPCEQTELQTERDE